MRPTRAAQHSECSSGHGPRFLANLWQTALSGRPADALCLVELRGFEPLTPCMPSRDPRHSTHHETLRRRVRPWNRAVDSWWLVVALAVRLLPLCCRLNWTRDACRVNGGNLWPLPYEVKNGPLNGAVPRGLPRSTPEFSLPRRSVGDRCCPVVHAPAVPEDPDSGLQPYVVSRGAGLPSADPGAPNL